MTNAINNIFYDTNGMSYLSSSEPLQRPELNRCIVRPDNKLMQQNLIKMYELFTLSSRLYSYPCCNKLTKLRLELLLDSEQTTAAMTMTSTRPSRKSVQRFDLAKHAPWARVREKKDRTGLSKSHKGVTFLPCDCM